MEYPYSSLYPFEYQPLLTNNWPCTYLNHFGETTTDQKLLERRTLANIHNKNTSKKKYGKHAMSCLAIAYHVML